MVDTHQILIDPSNANQFQAWDGDEGAYWAAHVEHFEEALTGPPLGLGHARTRSTAPRRNQSCSSRIAHWDVFVSYGALPTRRRLASRLRQLAPRRLPTRRVRVAAT